MKQTAKSKRPEKLTAISEVINLIDSSEYCLVLNYGGLTVSAFSELRRELVKNDSTVHVVKNSYLSRAIEKKGWDAMEQVLKGPTAVIVGSGDPAEVAKSVVTFLKKNDKASIKGAQLQDSTLNAEEVEQLSKLPSKDIMRAMLLGTMMAPATSMVRVLVAPLTGVLYVLKAKQEKDDNSAA
ncbi:MAG: 50S ribosomal protein L10 [Lentisphaerae bacterium]|jgi:large subunit ribosomal protein L10|nr:50S ribosomal protein L10 [Lentisphaerota bacterium]